MLKNYFKTLLRNMQKNKLHTGINVIGMSVAFTCSILMLLFVYQQFTFNNFHSNVNRLYQVYNSYSTPGQIETSLEMGYPVAPALKAEGIGIEKATRYKNAGRGARYKGKELELQINLVDEDFFSMFSFPVVSGNKAAPLASLANVVISEASAIKIFGTEDPFGKTVDIKIDGEWKPLMVSAILKDYPDNSSFRYEILARPEISNDYAENKNKWDNHHHPVYVQLSASGTKVQVERQLRGFVNKYTPGDATSKQSKGYTPDENGDMSSLRLYPFADIHFATVGGRHEMNKPFLFVIMLVSFVIVLIACFNFINLNIGLAFTRTKEMGIRKCLGAGKRQVWLQIWGESLFTVLVAMLIGILCISLILQYLAQNTRIPLHSSLLYQPMIVLILLAILLGVSFIAAGYPSFLMGKLKAVEILKGKISLKKPGMFRNALIVVQFVIACVFICSTIIIYQQFEHLKSAPLGYNTASIISIPIRDQAHGKAVIGKMRMLLADQPSIASVSGSTINLGVGQDHSTTKTSSSFEYDGKSINTNWVTADYDILKTLSITPKEGNDFARGYVTDSSHPVIVTESMARQLSDKPVTGMSFQPDSTQPKLTIIGVIPDFHLYSMREKSEPLTISFNGNNMFGYVLIKVNTKNTTATMNLVKASYAQVEPGVEFKGSYVNENIERWYETEQMLSKMFSIAAGIAIVLSCMGLFGIAFIVIRQRVKEIGVRKVLGASISSVAMLVTKEFIRPVLLAIVIATPIAWFIMNKWLQDFDYRINIQWTIFLAAGFIAVFIAIATVMSQAIKAAVANPVKSLRTE
ncbi:MAG: FtsX-like permease family protein [Ferruginibacter sp.]